MHNNPGWWKGTLAKCAILQDSKIEEKGDGHVSIAINALISMEPNNCDKQSKEAASKILSLCEISEICLTGNYGITLTSRYDGCTITIDDLCFEPIREENLDKESVRLDNELNEIDWIGYPQVSLYIFLEEIVGSDLAKVFLRHFSPEVCLRRIYYPEECQRHLSRIYRTIKKPDYDLWDSSNPVWAIVPRKG